MSLILIANNQTFTRSGRRILERKNGRADYRVRVYINDRPIWDGTIANYLRDLGAPGLIKRISEAINHSLREPKGERNGKRRAHPVPAQEK